LLSFVSKNVFHIKNVSVVEAGRHISFPLSFGFRVNLFVSPFRITKSIASYTIRSIINDYSLRGLKPKLNFEQDTSTLLDGLQFPKPICIFVVTFSDSIDF